MVVLQLPRHVQRFFRALGLSLFLMAPLFMYAYKYCLGDGRTIYYSGGGKQSQASSVVGHLEGEKPSPASGPSSPSSDLKVDLVMATVVGDDISWVSGVKIPNMRVLQYFADDQKATYHPARNKGREATMYHTYIHDHYDSLPDIVIFIHAHENPWHAEPVLKDSMTFSLNQLDLAEVQRRGYANLRVSWYNACPEWIRTDTMPVDPSKKEEPFMWRAFVENFAPNNDSSLIKVPKVFGAPCCSQFAVTREKIRLNRQEDYRKHLNWMLTTDLTDYISGRTWEHMFPYLFTKRPVDCPIEWKSFCTLYHVCFENQGQVREFVELSWESQGLEQKLGFWYGLFHPSESQAARLRVAEIAKLLEAKREVAIERGLNDKLRAEVAKDIYSD